MIWTNYDGRTEDLYGFQGITTRQAFGGTMVMEYTRIDNCGRPYLGYYCLHFHYVGVCPDCAFKGNAITDSNNKAISIHETHQTLVDRNVVFRHRGAFLYLEDGSERDNIISNNVLGCPQLNNPKNPDRNNVGNTRLLPCTLWGVGEHTDADQLEQGGIYQNAFNNHILGNRVYNMQNAHLIYNTFGKGTGAAEGKMCKNQMPYGRWKDNVFHHCQGLGGTLTLLMPLKSSKTRMDTSLILLAAWTGIWKQEKTKPWFTSSKITLNIALQNSALDPTLSLPFHSKISNPQTMAWRFTSRISVEQRTPHHFVKTAYLSIMEISNFPVVLDIWNLHIALSLNPPLLQLKIPLVTQMLQLGGQ